MAEKVTYKGPIWLTRDSDGDGLSDIICAWHKRPVRHRAGDGAVWLDDRDNVYDRLARYWREDAIRRFKTVPDDDLQCIRIGNDTPKGIKPA
jgi:hypothetical protein